MTRKHERRSDGGIDELEPFRRFLRLSREITDVIQELAPVIVPQIPQVADRFYTIMETIPEAMAIFKGGRTQLLRQREALCTWLNELFTAAYCEDYLERRRNVGIVHLNAGVDEQLMIASMNWLRVDLTSVIENSSLPPTMTREQALHAVHAALDFDLGIILNSYWTDLHSRTMRIDRLALIGQFTAAINHELRNPLGVILTSAYLMRQRINETTKDETILRHIDKIDRSIERANSIVNGLLRLMRVQVPTRHVVELPEFIRESISEVRVPKNVGLEFNEGKIRAMASFDRDQLRQVIENLVRNAIEAIVGDGRVQIHYECDPIATTICVRDNGSGIPAEVKHRVFEPLFSTKPVGTGLGLTLAKAIVEAHGGSLSIAPGLDAKGAGFEIRIPHFLVPNVPHHG